MANFLRCVYLLLTVSTTSGPSYIVNLHRAETKITSFIELLLMLESIIPLIKK